MILVVDDDCDFASDLSILLQSHFNVITASGSQEALKLCAEVKPQAAILDLQMPAFLTDDPEIEGAELVRALRAELKEDLPIIIVTRGVPDVLAGSLDEKVAGIFTKPIIAGKIIEFIESLLAEKAG